MIITPTLLGAVLAVNMMHASLDFRAVENCAAVAENVRMIATLRDAGVAWEGERMDYVYANPGVSPADLYVEVEAACKKAQ